MSTFRIPDEIWKDDHNFTLPLPEEDDYETLKRKHENAKKILCDVTRLLSYLLVNFDNENLVLDYTAYIESLD